MPEDPKYGYDGISTYKKRVMTARTCKEGDWVLFEFDEPIECRQAEFFTGRYNVPSALVQVGYLEISEDGVNFERVADLSYGIAKVVNPRPIKAARIVAEKESVGTSRIWIGAPILYPKW